MFGSRRKILFQKVEHIIAFALGSSSLLIADDVADEPEISQEFVINDVILTSIPPEHIRPVNIDFLHNTVCCFTTDLPK